MGFNNARRLNPAIFALAATATSAQQESVDDEKTDSPDIGHNQSPDKQLAAYDNLSHEGGLDEAENAANPGVGMKILRGWVTRPVRYHPRLY